MKTWLAALALLVLILAVCLTIGTWPGPGSTSESALPQSRQASQMPPSAAMEAEELPDGPTRSVLGPEAKATLDVPPSDYTGSVVVNAKWIESGLPASSVEVLLSQRRMRRSTALPMTGRTDEDGQVVFEGLRVGSYRATSPLGAGVDVDVATSGEHTVELHIPAGLAALVRVRDSDGAVVAGASIWVSDGFFVTMGREYGKTDADGVFTDIHIPSGRYLGVQASGFLSSDLFVTGIDLLPAGELEIVVRRGGAVLEGLVRDSHTRLPMDGAVVCVGPLDGFPHSGQRSGVFRTGPPPFRVRTAHDGTFRVEGIPQGRVPLTVLADDHAPKEEVFDARDGSRAWLDVDMDPSCELTGRVLDGSGNPAPGSIVGFGDRASFQYAEATADSSGTFSFGSLPCRPAHISARHASLGISSPAALVSPGRPIEIRLVPFHRVSGRIIDVSDRPLAGWSVQILLWDDQLGRMSSAGNWLSDADGEFSANLTATATPIDVAVRAPGRLEGMPRLVRRQAEWPREPLRIVVPAPLRCEGRVIGRLVDRAGKPLPQHGLILRTEDGANQCAVMASVRGGTFEFDEVCPGSYRIYAHVGESLALLGAVSVLRGETVDTGEVIAPTAGTVRVMLGPLFDGRSDCGIRIGAQDGRIALDTVALPEAGLEIELEAGSYVLRWEGPQVGERAFVVRAGERVVLQLVE